MLSVKELRNAAANLSAEKFKKQLGPFALIQRPPPEKLKTTQKMGVLANVAATMAAKPEEISKGILSLLFEFDELQVSTLPPMSDADLLTVGRLPDCDLVLDHKSVSKRHAELRWDAKQRKCFIRDLGSTNGTFLNSSLLVRKEAALRDGDIVSFGEVQFWYLLTQTLHAKLAGRLGGSW